MRKLTELKEWQALKEHREMWCHTHLRDLFSSDPERFQQFSFTHEDILFDFSKNHINDKTMELLLDLAKARELETKIAQLFSGEKLNRSENRPAMHVALRHRGSEPYYMNDENISHKVSDILDKMNHFVSKVRNGEWRGYTNETITHIVNIGVGGSELGPVLLTKALASADKLKIHFVSTLDGEQAAELIAKLNPARTLFIIVSKSFSTEDTLINANIIRDWFNSSAKNHADAFKKHFIGVSANQEAMTKYGLPKANQFEFWEWVGGRYSVCSAVGLVTALAIGMEQFEAFLQGAFSVDSHFRTAPLARNIPVIMALLTVWYRNFMGSHSHVILPYDTGLDKFPAYLQQLEMESCGKQVTQGGDLVDYETGGVVWGDLGFNGEHTFFQFLHQGTEFIPADFMVPIHATTSNKKCRESVFSHALAQSRALMLGRSSDEKNKELPPHKVYSGDKPSTMIIFPKVTPQTLGALIATYEHKVFVQSVLWDINPFDQWGTEFGKTLSKQLLPMIRGEEGVDESFDSSTQGLIDYIRSE